MTFKEALKAEIGDVLIAMYNSSEYRKGDEVILVERARDVNEMEYDTAATFYNRTLNATHGGNIQSFSFKV